MARELPNWIDAYLKYTERSEPPLSYHTWTGLTMLAGTLQRKVYLKWGFEEIYPNLYVVLIGPSGKARKGIAIGIGKEILKDLNIPMTSESNTREAMILAQKRAINNFNDGGTVRFHCSLTAFSEELSVFLGQSDIKYLSTLTDWYDSKSDWTYETKGTGKDHLQGVCVTLLGGTAPDWLQSILPQEAIGGGFTSRIIFVVEDRKGKTVPKHILTKKEVALRRALVADLEKINQMAGAFEFSPAGEKTYISWYEDYDKELEAGRPPVEDPRFSGYCERRPTHLRKLAMIMSAAHTDSRVIEPEDINRALSVLVAAERKMPKTFGGMGKAKYSEMTEKVMEFIRMKGYATRSEILRLFYRDIDGPTMNIIEEVLDQMKVVRIRIIPDKADAAYDWIGKKQDD